MAYATISFKHPVTKKIKTAPVGYSWTTLLFGLFVPIVRNHWLGFFFLTALTLIIFVFTNIIMSFVYNKMYIKHLIGEGYKISDTSTNLDDLAQKLALTLPTQTDPQTQKNTANYENSNTDSDGHAR